MNVVTPYEPPSSLDAASAREGAATRRHAVRTTPWVRLEMAAASARGGRRQVNEDCHSALDGSAPVFVVADGVGGGAVAAQASPRPVSRLHVGVDRHPIDATAL